MSKGYVSFVLSENARDRILSVYEPSHPLVVCHHVTYEFGVFEGNSPELPDNITVYGYAKNDKIEALVVSVGDMTHRPDGKVFHITLSHTKEGRPVMSNDLLLDGWTTSEKIILSSNDYTVEFNSF